MDAQAVQGSLAIRPQTAMTNPGSKMTGLASSQIGRRVRQAAVTAGLGDGSTGRSDRAGMART